MANSSQTIKLRSTKANRKTFLALQTGTDGYGDVGTNDGSRIVAIPYLYRYVCTFTGGVMGATTLAAATTQVFDLHTAFPANLMPEGIWILGCALRVITPLSGGAVSAAVASLGDAANDDEWVDDQDVFTGASLVPASDTLDADAVSSIAPAIYEDAYIPVLTIVTTTANVNALTAGQLEIMFLCVDYPDYD